MRKFALLLLVLCAPAVYSAATSIQFELNYNPNGGILTQAHPSAGTIELTNKADGTVDVSVLLNSGFSFVNTGAHDSFAFTISPSGVFTFSNLSTGWNVSDGGPNAPFADFGQSVDCSDGTGTDACANGSGSYPFPNQLFFNLASNAGPITFSNFIANANGVYFSADVYSNWTGLTGVIGSDPPPETVPEPASIAMLGTALVTLAGVTRRRLGR